MVYKPCSAETSVEWAVVCVCGEGGRVFPNPPAFTCWCGTNVGPTASLDMENLNLRRAYMELWPLQGVRGDFTGHEKFILIFWGRWMPMGGRHREK